MEIVCCFFFQLCVNRNCTSIETFTAGFKPCPNNCSNGNGVSDFMLTSLTFWERRTWTRSRIFSSLGRIIEFSLEKKTKKRQVVKATMKAFQLTGRRWKRAKSKDIHLRSTSVVQRRLCLSSLIICTEQLQSGQLTLPEFDKPGIMCCTIKIQEKFT